MWSHGTVRRFPFRDERVLACNSTIFRNCYYKLIMTFLVFRLALCFSALTLLKTHFAMSTMSRLMYQYTISICFKGVLTCMTILIKSEQ